MIEADIVAGQHASMPQQSDHISGDRRKRRRVDHIACGDAVNARRSDVSPRIHQAFVLVANLALRGQEHNGDLYDAVMTPRREPRRLDIDYGNVASTGCLHSHVSDSSAAPFSTGAHVVRRQILHRLGDMMRRVTSRYVLLSARMPRIRAEIRPTDAAASGSM